MDDRVDLQSRPFATTTTSSGESAKQGTGRLSIMVKVKITNNFNEIANIFTVMSEKE